MADVEIKRKVRLSRQEAGERLVQLRGRRSGQRRAQLDFDGDSIRFTVAEKLDWEFELEVDDHGLEIEVELKWSHASAAPAPPAGAKPVRTSRRGGDGG